MICRDIRPRSILNCIPTGVFYPTVAALGIYSLYSDLAGRRVNWPAWKVAALALGSLWVGSKYARASHDVGRVFNVEQRPMTWDEWEAKYPLMRHVWAWFMRFSV
jgi:hypothetical protein